MKKRNVEHSHEVFEGLLTLFRKKDFKWSDVDEYMDNMTEDDMWLAIRLTLYATKYGTSDE